jgi:ubiquinone/menaquinone biosynthesis C-methylase UbiE
MDTQIEAHQETANLEKYARTGGVEGGLLKRFREGLVRAAAELEPASVLDAGCGEGVATAWLADALPGAAIAGVDARPEAIEQARTRVPAAAFAMGDLYSLPYPDRSFDLVVSTEVLEHLERPEAAVAELLRVSGGHVLVTVPHEPFFRAGNMARGRYLRRLGSTPGHLNTWSRRGIVRLVSEQAEIERAIGLFPWQAVLARA